MYAFMHILAKYGIAELPEYFSSATSFDTVVNTRDCNEILQSAKGLRKLTYEFCIFFWMRVASCFTFYFILYK